MVANMQSAVWINFSDCRKSLLLFLLLVVSFRPSFAQVPPAQTSSVKKSQPAQPKLTATQERGLRLLKAAEGEAAGLAPDMRAFVLWLASYAHVPVDPKKAESLTKDSFTATEAIEDPPDKDQCGQVGTAGDIKSWIQEITQAEELLTQATEPVRTHITTELVKHYIEKKNLPPAQALLTSLADIEQYPFSAAADLVLAMGPEQAADRMTIFNQALNNFEQHGSTQMVGPDDMGSFLERTWTHVPSSVVLEAIDKMLDEAKSRQSKSHLSMASDKGTVNLNSTYELRLFQLLPVLNELDKDKAESLLRDDTAIQAQLAKYPKGMNSLTSQGNIYSYGITDDDSPQAAQSVAEQQVKQGAEQQMNPKQAINDALMLPLQDAFQSSSPRAQGLLMVAENQKNKKPTLAKSALDEILKIEDQLIPTQLHDLTDVPKIYFELGDEDNAKKALKVMTKAAEKLYAHDADAEDPNKAFKGTWPSADFWRKCVQIAAKISPALAEEIVNEIPDPEISVAQKVVFAGALLGQSSGVPILVGDCRKTGSRYNFSQ
ncbi:MAG: hypothetical protein DMG94_11275 [Acidobacteria bacterium]|nr:MAG: hypothetical protein DMG94_11275 [Acidobacteriota bacterium]